MWHQRDSALSADLKRPRNEVHQMEVDEFGPSVSKRAKTTHPTTSHAAYSSPGQNFYNAEEGNIPIFHSGRDDSALLTESNPNTPHGFSQQQQSPGQQSSERTFPRHPQQESHPGYQCMNSLLGNLHLSRRRQKASEAGVHQHSAQHIESSSRDDQASSAGLQKSYWRPPRPKSSQKKVISLRVDSNLY